MIEVDGRAQITDANWQPTTPYLFEWLLQRPTCDRPFWVQLDGKWGFVGLDGRLLFDPPSLDSVYPFDAGYAVVKQGAKWGIVDTTGRFVLAPSFDGLIERRDGLFHVLAGGRKVWLTATGEERPEPPVRIPPAPGILNCGHGLKLMERDGHWGMADAEGKEVIAPRYRALVCFTNGIAWAPIDTRRQWCALGPDGAPRERPPCKPFHYPYIQSHSYPEELDKDRFENSVLWTRAYLEFGAGKRDAPPRMIPDGPRAGYR